MIGGTSAAESEAVVSRALAVDDQVAQVIEGLASLEARLGPELSGKWLGRQHQGVDGSHIASVSRKGGGVTLGRPNHIASTHFATVSANDSGLQRCDRAVLMDGDT